MRLHPRRLLSSILVILTLMMLACGGDDRSSSSGSGSSSSASGSAGTASSPAASVKKGGTLRWATTYESDTLLAPLRHPSAYPAGWVLAVFSGLTRIDPTQEYKPVPDLAESWEVSADSLVYTFKLRANVTWHDGKPFTADDVKFTYDAIRDPKNAAQTGPDFALVDKVEVLAPLSVRVTLKQPFAPFLSKVAVGLFPKHLLDGKDITTDAYGQKPIGTGPFKVKDYRKGEFLSLEAYPAYWGGRPNLDQVIISFVPDPSALLLRLQTGELEGGVVTTNQLGQVNSNTFTTLSIGNASPTVFVYNLRSAVFTDPRVRVALNYLIDKDAVLKTAAGGKGLKAYGPLQNSPFDNPNTPKFEHDPAKAAQLLTEAGWRRAGSGWEKDGKPLAFTLFAPYAPDAANAMATSLKQNGVAVTVDQRDYRYVFSNPDKVDAVMYNFGSPTDADEIYFLMHSTAPIEKGGFNYGAYANKKVDAALDAGRTTLELAKRKAIYQEMQVELAADPPYGWGIYPDTHFAIKKSVHGYTPVPGMSGGSERFLFFNLKDWWIE